MLDKVMLNPASRAHARARYYHHRALNLIDRLGLDPALSSGPLVTTFTDVLGYASFLGFATYFLL